MSTATAGRPASARPADSRSRGGGSGRSGGVASIDPFRVLRRHLLLLVASGFFGAVLGVGAHVLLLQYYPLYSGEVLFEVQPGVLEASDVGTQNTLQDESVVRTAKTQLVLLESRQVLEAAVKTPEVQRKTTWFQQFRDKNGSPLIQEAVDELEETLRTSLVRGTELFSVGWSTHDKHDIPIVLNAVALAYNSMRSLRDSDTYNSNLEVFEDQLEKTSREIGDLDEEIKSFVQSADITSLDDPRYHQDAMTLRGLMIEVTKAQSALSLVHTNQLQIAAKLEGKMDYSEEDVLRAEMDYAVASHIRMEEAVKVELRVFAERYNPQHMAVKNLEGRLRAVKAARKETTQKIVERNLHAQLKMYISSMEQYRRMIESLEAEAEVKGTKLRELAAMQSKYVSMRIRREYLEVSRSADLDLIKEVKLMRVRLDAQRVRIALLAQTPREISFPKAEIIVPLCILLIGGATVGLIFLRELTDQRVKSASDIVVIPDARLLGVIPDCEEDPTKCRTAELVIKKFPKSVLAESYRQACGPLSKAIDRAGYQTIVVTGGLPGAGSTTVVSNLAAGLAASGRRVLMVDANFRRPRLAAVFGVEPERPGLGDMLVGVAGVEETTEVVEDGLSIMTAGTPANRVIERLNTEKFNSVVAELRSRYDVIMFDAPPAVVAGDSLVIANKVDAAILVIRANQEQRGLVSRLIRQFSDSQSELLGILLNRPRGTAGGYFKKNYATMAKYEDQKA